MKGRMNHEGRTKRATGGSVAQKGEHQEETNKASTEKMHIADGHYGKERGNEKEEVTKKKGGRVKRKKGGHVPGHAAPHRLDKRKRGGRISSPEHPLSGADAPNLPYGHGNLKAGSEGQGKDRTKF